MDKSMKPILIITSIAALLNVMFLPVYDVWGGLFPDSDSLNFFEVMETFFKNSDAWQLWVVEWTVCIFIPSFFMLIASLAGQRGFFITSCVIGILLWFGLIFRFGEQFNGLDSILDFEDGNLSIGTWVAIILFFISFFLALYAKKPSETKIRHATVSTSYSSKISNIPSINEAKPITPSNFFCPNCGVAINEKKLFCGNCGHKF